MQQSICQLPAFTQRQGVLSIDIKPTIDLRTVDLFCWDCYNIEKADYMNTQEGKKLPVVHCTKGTPGWEICDELKPFVQAVVDKPTFGSIKLPHLLSSCGEEISQIELCGLCTDICVISNAMLLKASFPEAKIIVDSSCCAGVTTESHQTALDAMKAVQIEII